MGNNLLPITHFLVTLVCGYLVLNKIFNYMDSEIRVKVSSFAYQKRIDSLPLQYIEIKNILQDIKYSNLKTGLLSNMVRIEVQDIVDDPTFRFIIYKDIYVKIKDNNGFIKFCGAFYDGKALEDLIK